MKSDKLFLLFVLTIIIITACYLKKDNTENEENISQIQDTSVHYSTDSIFKTILECSNEQLLVDKSILLKTISFMIEETDEYDPKLIEFVRSLIHKPFTHRKLNLTDKTRTDFSQIGQSKYIDNLLKSKRNGFFIEAGGFDGEAHSNSLFFELERGWNGILIEPIPSFYQSILSKNRNIFSINACIANKKPIVAKFRIYDVLSGRVKEMRNEHEKRIDKVSQSKEKVLLYIPCFSLNTILAAINVNKIDYFSLDVEGGEYDVLTSIDYKKTIIDSFTIEHNGFTDDKLKIKTYLENIGYTTMKEDGQDIYLIRNS